MDFFLIMIAPPLVVLVSLAFLFYWGATFSERKFPPASKK